MLDGRLNRSGLPSYRDALIIGAGWTVLSSLSARIAITPAPRHSRASQGTWTFALRRPIYRALRDLMQALRCSD